MKGDVKINNVDAFERYGINLEDGAISTLMTFPPMKEFIESKSRTANGKIVIIKSPKYDERDISLPFHLIAKSKEEFFQKYERFCNEVLATGRLYIETKYQTGVIYKLIYQNCTQFTQFQQEMAKFVLKVCEPNPIDRW